MVHAYRFQCKRCGQEWVTVLEHPKVCRWCGNSRWDQERVNKVGAGRPKGSVSHAGERVGVDVEVEDGGHGKISKNKNNDGVFDPFADAKAPEPTPPTEPDWDPGFTDEKVPPPEGYIEIDAAMAREAGKPLKALLRAAQQTPKKFGYKMIGERHYIKREAYEAMLSEGSSGGI